jgi:hypothetical protein
MSFGPENKTPASAGHPDYKASRSSMSETSEYPLAANLIFGVKSSCSKVFGKINGKTLARGSQGAGQLSPSKLSDFS